MCVCACACVCASVCVCVCFSSPDGAFLCCGTARGGGKAAAAGSESEEGGGVEADRALLVFFDVKAALAQAALVPSGVSGAAAGKGQPAPVIAPAMQIGLSGTGGAIMVKWIAKTNQILCR